LQIQNLKPNGALLSGFGYGYNAVGQITSWTNLWDTLPTRVLLPAYDAIDELTNVVSTGGPGITANYTYAYDVAQNRTLAKTNGVQEQFQFNTLDQMTSDSAGSASAATYEWDALNRLVAVNAGIRRTEFSYDGLGRRARIVEKMSGVKVADNYFLWNGNIMSEERDGTGGTVVRRFFPQGESVVGAGTTNLFYTRDHLGSIREMLDISGTVQARYDYDVFGQRTALTENIPASFGFTGHYTHRPTGLYLAMLRAYDPRLDRWLSRDPLGMMASAGSVNLYAYVGNDPLNRVDPFGDRDKIDSVADFIYGVGNGMSFGLGDYISTKFYNWLDPCFGTGIDKNSTAYFAGELTGTAITFAAGGWTANGAKAANAARAATEAEIALGRTGTQLYATQNALKGAEE